MEAIIAHKYELATVEKVKVWREQLSPAPLLVENIASAPYWNRASIFIWPESPGRIHRCLVGTAHKQVRLKTGQNGKIRLLDERGQIKLAATIWWAGCSQINGSVIIARACRAAQWANRNSLGRWLVFNFGWTDNGKQAAWNAYKMRFADHWTWTSKRMTNGACAPFMRDVLMLPAKQSTCSPLAVD